MRAASDPAAPSEERTAIPQRHPATAKAWAWFDENEAAMEFSRRVSILDKLLELDRLLRDLDGGTAE